MGRLVVVVDCELIAGCLDRQILDLLGIDRCLGARKLGPLGAVRFSEDEEVGFGCAKPARKNTLKKDIGIVFGLPGEDGAQG